MRPRLAVPCPPRRPLACPLRRPRPPAPRRSPRQACLRPTRRRRQNAPESPASLTLAGKPNLPPPILLLHHF